jgi:hypothetical protein
MEFDLKSPDDITGGYLIELDNDPAHYSSESAYFTVRSDGTDYAFVCKSPEIWTYKEDDYMSRLVQDVFDAMNLAWEPQSKEYW